MRQASDNASQAYLLAGSHALALSRAREAVSVRRQLSDQRGLAEALRNLGGLLADAHDSDQAGAAWREAAGILRELGDPSAAEVEALADGTVRID